MPCAHVTSGMAAPESLLRLMTGGKRSRTCTAVPVFQVARDLLGRIALVKSSGLPANRRFLYKRSLPTLSAFLRLVDCSCMISTEYVAY